MNSPRILVVDDTPDLLDLFSTLLQRAGYKVLRAATGQECLRIVREELPDLVLLDVMLPDLDGIEVCKRIKSDRDTAAVLVIHISGMRTSADNEAEGLEAGADGYLTKPVEPRALLAHMNALLRVKQTERALSQSEQQFRAAKRIEEERAQLLSRLVTAQEEEQRRLSRELHDQMGQSVAALRLGLKALDDSGHFQSSESNRLRQLQELTNQLARDVHDLAASLRPPALDDLGLCTALSNYVEEWADRSRIAVDFHSNGLLKRRLPPQVETTVYRIIQEALTNVLKHARARNVSVILENRANRLMAIVEDDGSGFDVEAMMGKPMSERRLGLMGMKERVSLVGGKLDIESTLSAGTTVIVHIPIATALLEEPLEETTHPVGR
jgi:signal transduction histidine kinase